MQHNGKEIEIIYLPFPAGVQGTVTGCLTECSRYYRIAIDSTRSPQAQRYALGHELAHLFLDHLNQPGRPIQEQEREANSKAWHYYRYWKRYQQNGTNGPQNGTETEPGTIFKTADH